MRIIRPIESVLAIVLLSIILYLLLKLQWILMTGLVIGFLGAISEWVASKVAWIWNLTTRSIGAIVSRAILSIVYFLMLTPLAWLYRVFSKNTFAKRSGKSYYKIREHIFKPEDLKNPW